MWASIAVSLLEGHAGSGGFFFFERLAREDVALSYVYANSGCVAASWLCVL